MFNLTTVLGLKVIRTCYSIGGAGEPSGVKEWNRSLIYVQRRPTGDVNMRPDVIPADTSSCRGKKTRFNVVFGEASDAYVV